MISIVDYGVGNLKSIKKALEMVGAKTKITRDLEDLKNSSGIVLPGVGAVRPAMEKLKELKEFIKSTDVPVLGICLGMQLFATLSYEGGEVECLNIIPGVVRKFQDDVGKIPHMGWNQIEIVKDNELLHGIESGTFFYFVHSYFLETEKSFILTETDYGISFASAVSKDNYYGVQFHPEKSGDDGIKLLENFYRICRA
ncbi:imidazole glycerol phosphate synthase subunit hisH [Archaeoglobus sulfaticallidus PM70-1]|uniref:Imidazole glycerol phosphate synthase subunit HisH n=1 Tax=Archaeoglobus sulfaticallidus PM70-1 TaxID=387631 RepID=N0BBS8_9EURY|nr:imidazole glycerol phosphate synthase subunit HisH [Archaeoglobus sulfaticallidus]AGK60453.1 imidazole glycerol phosphate synthase subunit hisH [Archaeoglobus sulfaticallidus PM70-1]